MSLEGEKCIMYLAFGAISYLVEEMESDYGNGQSWDAVNVYVPAIGTHLLNMYLLVSLFIVRSHKNVVTPRAAGKLYSATKISTCL